MHTKTLIAGIDFDSASEPALDAAIDVARATGATVRPVHVVPLPRVAEFGDRVDELRRDALSHSQTLLRSRHRPGATVEPPVIRVGEPATELLGEAAHNDVRMVFLGLTTATALDRWLRDSVKLRVLQHTRRPLWLAHPDRDRGPIERVLCAIDTTRLWSPSLDAARAIARAFDARLDLLRVTPERQARPGSRREQVQALRDYTSRFDLSDIDVTYRPVGGEPGGRIVAEAERLDADLLVLGPSSHRGLSRWSRRRAPELSIHRLSCSVVYAPLTHAASRFARAATLKPALVGSW